MRLWHDRQLCACVLVFLFDPFKLTGCWVQPRALQLTVNLKSAGRRMTLDPNADKSATGGASTGIAGMAIAEEESGDEVRGVGWLLKRGKLMDWDYRWMPDMHGTLGGWSVLSLCLATN